MTRLTPAQVPEATDHAQQLADFFSRRGLYTYVYKKPTPATETEVSVSVRDATIDPPVGTVLHVRVRPTDGSLHWYVPLPPRGRCRSFERSLPVGEIAAMGAVVEATLDERVAQRIAQAPPDENLI